MDIIYDLYAHIYVAPLHQRSRQRGLVSSGYRRGGRSGRRSSDPLHADPGLLLRKRYQHFACKQHEPPGRDSERYQANRRRANGPALRLSHCTCHFLPQYFKKTFSRVRHVNAKNTSESVVSHIFGLAHTSSVDSHACRVGCSGLTLAATFANPWHSEFVVPKTDWAESCRF